MLAASKAYGEAELKFQIAELANKFIQQCDDSIARIMKLQDEINLKNQRISELEDKLEDKDSYFFSQQNKVYHKKTESGTAYCPQCYAEGKKNPMSSTYDEGYTVLTCSAFPRKHQVTIEGGLQA